MRSSFNAEKMFKSKDDLEEALDKVSIESEDDSVSFTSTPGLIQNTLLKKAEAKPSVTGSIHFVARTGKQRSAENFDVLREKQEQDRKERIQELRGLKPELSTSAPAFTSAFKGSSAFKPIPRKEMAKNAQDNNNNKDSSSVVTRSLNKST